MEDSVEYWFARDLQKLLEYDEWRNFELVIKKAILACENSKQLPQDHFVGVNKMVPVGSGAERELADYRLTRYACYLIAQNGDPRKEQIAFAMSYFAFQTRRAELIAERVSEIERVQAREKLTETEKVLSSLIYENGIDHDGFARIRSVGDTAFFGGHSTAQMKSKLGIAKTKPLADHLPTVTLKAKDFATAITNHNIVQKSLKTEGKISKDHEKNNLNVRKLLLDEGIRPETLPKAEDVQKIKRKIASDNKRIAKEANKK